MDKNSDNNGSRRSGSDSDNNSDGRPQLPKRSNNSLLIFLILASLLALLFYQQTEKRSEILVSQFQEELEKDNVADVRIADRYVFGEFKIPPDAPLSEVSDGKSKSDEPGEPKKLLKEFAVVRPNDAGWVVNLENELKAKQIRFGYQAPDETLQMLSLFAMIGLPLAILFFLFMMFRRTRSDLMGADSCLASARVPQRDSRPTKKW